MKQLDNLQELIGKRVVAVDETGDNCKILICSDGTEFHLEAENAGPPIGLMAITTYLKKKPKKTKV